MTVAEQRHERVRDPVMQRRMVEIGETEIARIGDRVAFIDGKAEHSGDAESAGEKGADDRQCHRIGIFTKGHKGLAGGEDLPEAQSHPRSDMRALPSL